MCVIYSKSTFNELLKNIHCRFWELLRSNSYQSDEANRDFTYSSKLEDDKNVSWKTTTFLTGPERDILTVNVFCLLY